MKLSSRPPKYPATAPQIDPEHHCESSGSEGHLERGLPAHHQPAQNVVADVVGAQWPARPRGEVLHCEPRRDLVRVVEMGPDEAEQQQPDDDDQADEGQAVFGEGGQVGASTPLALVRGRRPLNVGAEGEFLNGHRAVLRAPV